MNRNYFYSIALLLLTGCTQESLTGGSETQSVPIGVSVSVKGETDTRAATTVQETQFDAGETFYVFFADSKATVANAKFTTSNTNGATSLADGSTQPYFADGSSSVTLHAYYPQTVTEGSSAFSVLADQTSDGNFKLSDLMYATKSVDKSGTLVTAPLMFAHKLSKMVVIVQVAADVSNITNVSIIKGYRTINITDGTTCALGTTTSDEISDGSPVTLYDNATGAASVSCAAMLPPQSITGDFIKVTTASDGAALYNVTKTLVTGHTYTVVLNISKAALARTLGVTSDWSDPAEEYSDPKPAIVM